MRSFSQGGFNNILVAGIDGSGKSTFLQLLEREAGYLTLEPTSTDAAREFKSRTLDTPIDTPLVDEREELYFGLNSSFDKQIEQHLRQGARVATTGSKLSTILSHNLMRDVACGFVNTTSRTIDEWTAHSPVLKPDAVVHVHAPIEVISTRITERQNLGDSTEKYWGFNAPFYLKRYQEEWAKLLSNLVVRTDISCISLDSSILTPEGMLDKFMMADK